MRNSVCDWIVTDGIPFNKVNGEGFRRMMKKINPQFQPPCSQTIKQHLGFGYQIAKGLMKNMLNIICDNVLIYGLHVLKMVILELLCIILQNKWN